MLMRPAKCEAKAEAKYHKAEVEAKAKKNYNYKLLMWIQLKKYCNSSHDSVKW